MFRSVFKIIIFILILNPYFSHAEIIISEIMYDLEGSDAGNEWLEILNTGSSTVIINDYHFYEAGVHHGLNNESIIEMDPGEYAVIVQDIDGFIDRYGSGNNLLRSSFSLNNTGEELAISDEDKNIIYSVSYDSSFGGQGNGNSLSYGNNGWFQSAPTPGGNAGSEVVVTDEEETDSTSSSASNNNNQNNNNNTHFVRTSIQEIESFKAHIRIPDSGLTHSNVPIEAYVNHTKDFKTTKKLGGTYYLSFGDGNFLESDRRYDIDYQYAYPGVYTLALEYYKSSLSRDLGKDPDAFLTKDIIIHEPSINITEIDSANGITIKNELNKSIDLYGWNISSNNQVFTFPKYSFIGSGREKIISSNIHGISTIYNQDWAILRNEHNVTISSFTKNSKKLSFARGESLPEILPIERISESNTLNQENNIVPVLDVVVENITPTEEIILPPEDFNLRYLSQHPNKVLVDFDEPKNILTESDGNDNGFPLYIIIIFGALSLLLVGVRIYQKTIKPSAVPTDKVVGDIELI